MESTKEQRQILCKSWKKCGGDSSSDLISVPGRKHEPYTECSDTETEKGDTSEEKSQERAHEFL
jgi:hypothetical protein